MTDIATTSDLVSKVPPWIRRVASESMLLFCAYHLGIGYDGTHVHVRLVGIGTSTSATCVRASQKRSYVIRRELDGKWLIRVRARKGHPSPIVGEATSRRDARELRDSIIATERAAA